MFTDKELEQNVVKANYYNFKSLEVKDDYTGKVAKKYVFTKYNREAGQDEYAFKKVAAYIKKITLGEVKEYKTSAGKPFFVQNLYIELNAYKDGKLERGVIKINKKSKIFEIVVSKLANLTDFSWITFEGYTFKDKAGQYRQTVLVKDKNGKSLQKRVNFKHDNPEYQQPSNLIVIPKFEPVVDDQGHPILSEDGRVQSHPAWMAKKTKVYLDTLENIIKTHEEWVKNNPLIENNQPIKSTVAVPKNDEPQSFGVDDEEDHVVPQQPTETEFDKMINRQPIKEVEEPLNSDNYQYIEEPEVIMPY